jgi:hypothetical protein
MMRHSKKTTRTPENTQEVLEAAAQFRRDAGCESSDSEEEVPTAKRVRDDELNGKRVNCVDLVYNFNNLTCWSEPLAREVWQAAQGMVADCQAIHDGSLAASQRQGLVVHVIMAKEIGDEGNVHLQCCARMKNPANYSGWVKRFTLQVGEETYKPSVRRIRVSEHHATEYCKKDDKFFAEWHVDGWVAQKPQTDNPRGIVNDRQLVMDYISNADLTDLDAVWDHLETNFADVVFLNHGNIQKVMDRRIRSRSNRDPTFRRPTVVWAMGPTGTGKSRDANKWRGMFKMSSYFKTDGKWNEGLEHNVEFIFWDEFRPQQVTFQKLLQMTDGYSGVQVERKGGMICWRPKIIIFTAPLHPREMFCGQADEWAKYNRSEGEFDQFLRRIDIIIDYGKKDLVFYQDRRRVYEAFRSKFELVNEFDHDAELAEFEEVTSQL